MTDYKVMVRVTYEFSSLVEVEADTPEEARELALEEHECNWEDSEVVDTWAMVVQREAPEHTGLTHCTKDDPGDPQNTE